MLKKIPEIILDILFPPKEIENILRKIEISKIYNNCSKNIIRDSPSINSIFNYKDIFIKKSIIEIKKNKNKYAINKFSELLSEEILIYFEENIIKTDYKIPITFIPQYIKTYREKGFNQSQEIAKRISEIFFKNIELKTLLIKNKETEPQHKIKNRVERLKNLTGCFEINENEREYIKNKIIILIDDVTTTGATLNEGRRKLLDSGALLVICFTIAR